MNIFDEDAFVIECDDDCDDEDSVNAELWEKGYNMTEREYNNLINGK